MIFKKILSTVLLTSEKQAKNFQTDAVPYPDLGGVSFHGETSGGIANVLSGYMEIGLENLCMMMSFTTKTKIQYVLSFKFKFGNLKEVLHTKCPPSKILKASSSSSKMIPSSKSPY